MGDRANVVIKDSFNGPDVYLYTHSGGYELPEAVHAALARRKRWDDSPYLARIVFEAMIKGNEGGETGFGISGGLCDNDSYPLIVLDTKTQLVRLDRAGTDTYRRDGGGYTTTFAEFVTDPAPLTKAFLGTDDA